MTAEKDLLPCCRGEGPCQAPPDIGPCDPLPSAENGLPEPHVEWAVEVTWRDWQKAGAKGPTSQFGPFDSTEQVDDFVDRQRRDRDVVATRVFTRLAAYTAWDSTDEPEPTSEADLNMRLARYYDRMADAMGLHPHARVFPPGEGN